jgi:uncharacterized protein
MNLYYRAVLMRLSWLIPQEKKFYDLLEQYAGLARECTRTLMELFRNFDEREQKWQEIKALESKGDDLLHTIVDELNATFVTPIDREDIYALANGMDDILDFSEGAAERVMLFKITEAPAVLTEMSDVLFQAAKELESAMPLLRHPKKMLEMKKHYVEINRLENRGDKLMREALVQLFETGNPVEIIKLKEICEHVEEAIDRNEDVAAILESLIVKQM